MKQLRGQVYLGGDDFSQELNSRLGEKKLGRDIICDQQHLARPQVDDVFEAVMDEYNFSRNGVLDRRNKEAFRMLIYLLRRICNMPLRDVATLAGVSLGRVSQIQREVMNAELKSPSASKLLKKYEV